MRAEEQKEEKDYQLRPHICGLFFSQKQENEEYGIFRIIKEK